MNVEKIWHYTTGESLKMILLEGRLRAACVHIRLHKPVVSFSANQDWDPSASRSMLGVPEGSLATREQLIRVDAGLARIAVRSDMPGVIPWAEFKRTSGIDAKYAELKEEAALRYGSNVDWWYAVFADLSKESWAAVQVHHGYGWVDVPRNNWRLDETLALDGLCPELSRPVLSDRGIYLQCEDDILADRCTGLLREVWGRIPEADAQAIVEYWQTCGRGCIGSACQPIIECLVCDSCEHRNGGCTALGIDRFGHWLSLCSVAFHDQTDAVLIDELGRSLAYIRAMSRGSSERNDSGASLFSEAFRLASSWGFDCTLAQFRSYKG